MKINLDFILLIIIGIIIGYYMCKGNIREDFALSDDIKQAVNELYSTDVNTIRNLSDLAKKLQQGGLTIPGNVIINQDLTASGDFKANKKADITGNLTTNGDFKAKKAEITGNLITNGDFKAKYAEIAGNLLTNGDFKVDKNANIVGNLTTNGDFKVNKNANIVGNLIANQKLQAKDVEITGDLLNNGNLTVNNNAQINGKLSTDNFISHNNVEILGNLKTDGKIEAREIITISDLSTNGNITVKKNAKILDSLTTQNKLCIGTTCITQSDLQKISSQKNIAGYIYNGGAVYPLWEGPSSNQINWAKNAKPHWSLTQAGSIDGKGNGAGNGWLNDTADGLIIFRGWKITLWIHWGEGENKIFENKTSDIPLNISLWELNFQDRVTSYAAEWVGYA